VTIKKPIYLDYNSTTPVDPRVIQAMLPYFDKDFGNPANSLHQYGWSAENAVKKASEQMAQLIDARPHEITWTSGATEGNNTVIFGLVRQLKKSQPQEPIHIISSRAEHWSVLSALEQVEEDQLATVTYLPVNAEGAISVADLKRAIQPHTKLVSLIWVNNEVGAINPIAEVAEICQQNKIYFHTDGTQAVGKIFVDVKKHPIHFLTFSAHKFYGPKGVGVLYMRSQNPTVEIAPLIVGGGQQHNRRSGTLNVPAIVGAGVAAEICQTELSKDAEHTLKLLQKFYQNLQVEWPQIKINGPDLSKPRSPMNLSVVLPQAVDFVLPALTSLAFSQGSACQTSETTGSHVLNALGLTTQQILSTIRFSVGRFTTEQEIQSASEVVLNAFKTKAETIAPL